jgi:uncharacterized protein (TIGR02284 family)
MAYERAKDTNPDPITGEPGAHPVGTGLGAATGGAIAGAAVGAVAGPIGATLGGVAGAVTGGLAGKATAETINPTAEEAYWRAAYRSEPYFESDRTYDDYHPAYALGWAGIGTYGGEFDVAEPRLATEWERNRGASRLEWDNARPAVRAAWDRARGSASPGHPAGEVVKNEDVVDVLNDLLESCRDGEYGFRTSAEHAKSADIKTLLLRHANECNAAALELEREVLRLGGQPAKGGTASGAMHRGWVAVRAALTTQDDKAVLEECERGEDTAVARYRKALKQTLPADVRQLVEQQARGAQRNHDEVKALRDAFKKA